MDEGSAIIGRDNVEVKYGGVKITADWAKYDIEKEVKMNEVFANLEFDPLPYSQKTDSVLLVFAQNWFSDMPIDEMKKSLPSNYVVFVKGYTKEQDNMPVLENFDYFHCDNERYLGFAHLEDFKSMASAYLKYNRVRDGVKAQLFILLEK